MSVLIKGMEMPKTYPLTVTIYPDGHVLSETVGAKDKHGTAVPIPPHGRLIDADALVRELNYIRASFGSANGLVEGGLNIAVSTVNGRPTIIPANEEGE